MRIQCQIRKTPSLNALTSFNNPKIIIMNLLCRREGGPLIKEVHDSHARLFWSATGLYEMIGEYLPFEPNAGGECHEPSKLVSSKMCSGVLLLR